MSQIHGSALIEVYDAKTHKKLYEQKEDNIITNAYEKILQDYRGKLGYSMLDMFGDADSIVHALFGGILLFGSVIPSDANHMLPTDSERQSFIGCASCQGKITGSNYAGQFSADESEFTDTHAKFVYNFNTSEANGVINTICLTSAVGGYTGYKQAVQAAYATERSVIQPVKASSPWYMFNSLEYDTSNYYTTVNGFNIGGQIDDNAVICNSSKTLFHTYDGSTCRAVDLQKEITRKILLNKIDQTVVPSSRYTSIGTLENDVSSPIISLDADKLYWLSTPDYSTYIGDTLTLHYISMTEPESTKVYNTSSFNASVAQYYGNSNYAFATRCCIYNGKFYVYVYKYSDVTKGRIYVLDLDETSNDCSFVYSDFTVSQLMMNGTSTPSLLDELEFIRVDDAIYMSRGAISSNYLRRYFRVDPTTGAVDAENSTFTHRQRVQSVGTFGKQGIFETEDGLFWVTPYTTSSSSSRNYLASLFLPSGYLASINNLQNAVNKTADRTLKVTYTLTYS